MKELVSPNERTRTELLANSRRFRREGVSLITGNRDTLFRLPVNSRREITARSAVRLSDYRPSRLELILEKGFDLSGNAVIIAGIVLAVLVIAAQIYHVVQHAAAGGF